MTNENVLSQVHIKKETERQTRARRAEWWRGGCRRPEWWSASRTRTCTTPSQVSTISSTVVFGMEVMIYSFCPRSLYNCPDVFPSRNIWQNYSTHTLYSFILDLFYLFNLNFYLSLPERPFLLPARHRPVPGRPWTSVLAPAIHQSTEIPPPEMPPTRRYTKGRDRGRERGIKTTDAPPPPPHILHRNVYVTVTYLAGRGKALSPMIFIYHSQKGLSSYLLATAPSPAGPEQAFWCRPSINQQKFPQK